MDGTAELSSLLRRSAHTSIERILFLLYVLEARSGRGEYGGSVTGELRENSQLSLASIIAILRYAFPGNTPRFTIALGDKNCLLRSPDRCLSWKLMKVAENACSATAPADSTYGEGTGDGDELSKIVQLLPREQEEQDGKDEKCSEPLTDRASVKESITSLACAGNLVVIGGEQAHVAVSTDRGVTFTSIAGRLRSVMGEDSSIRYVAVVSNGVLVVATERAVVRVAFDTMRDANEDDGHKRIQVTDVSLVLACKSRVSFLRALPAGGGRKHVVVAESNTIHFSWNSGQTFISVPHSLGCIRSLSPLSCVRNVAKSPFPKSCKVVESLLSGADSSQNKANGGTQEYEYAFGCRRECDVSVAYPGLLSELQRSFRTTDTKENVFFQHYFAIGVGTEVLAYDYSCLLCLGFHITSEAVAVFSHATCVSYTPFVRSALSEAVPGAVSPSVGSEQVTFVRGSSGGVSFSKDACAWSTPQKSSPVAILAGDGDEVFIVGQSGVVSTVLAESTASVRASAIGGDFRSPAVVVAADLL